MPRNVLSKVEFVEKKIIRSDMPEFSPGDTVRVHAKIKEGEKERIQIFEGTVLGFSNTGARKSFTVRKSSHGVGVERVFPLFSPSIARIEKVHDGRVRRSKVYYLRKLEGKAARVRSEKEIQ